MMALNIDDIAGKMASAFLGELASAAADIAAYAEAEARKFAQSIATIGELYARGTIGKTEARLHLDIQRHASRSVLSSIAGLTLLAAERAINAALKVVRDIVNGTLGFSLIKG